MTRAYPSEAYAAFNCRNPEPVSEQTSERESEGTRPTHLVAASQPFDLVVLLYLVKEDQVEVSWNTEHWLDAELSESIEEVGREVRLSIFEFSRGRPARVSIVSQLLPEARLESAHMLSDRGKVEEKRERERPNR